MFDNNKPTLDMTNSASFLASVLDTDDVGALKEVIMSLLVVTGFWYKRTYIHTLLHPIFFLTGFAAGYFL